MTPLPPYEHLELRPEDPHDFDGPDCGALMWEGGRCIREVGHIGEHRDPELPFWYEPRRKPRPSRAVIGWLLVSLAVVLLVGVSVALFLRGFGA